MKGQRENKFKICWDFLIFFLTIFPVADILAFPAPKLGPYLMRATASYLYEGLLAAVIL